MTDRRQPDCAPHHGPLASGSPNACAHGPQAKGYGDAEAEPGSLDGPAAPPDVPHPSPHTHSVAGLEAHRPRQRRALAWALWLTLAMMIAEISAGLWTQSLMLLSDAVHMFSHAVSLAVSSVAIRMAARPRSSRSHYGSHRAEILASFLNGLGLFALSAWIVFESVERLGSPLEVRAREMMLVAFLGLVVNAWTAWILGRSGAEDLNTKSAYLHMLGDLFSSVVIVLGGLGLMLTGWTWLDPVLSVFVALVILYWAWGLVRSSVGILMERAPDGVSPEAISAALRSEPGVHDVHDLHVWEITSGYICLTAHLVVDDTPISKTAALRESACDLLRRRFSIVHATLQLESAEH